jgi:hypothetical protein
VNESRESASTAQRLDEARDCLSFLLDPSGVFRPHAELPQNPAPFSGQAGDGILFRHRIPAASSSAETVASHVRRDACSRPR